MSLKNPIIMLVDDNHIDIFLNLQLMEIEGITGDFISFTSAVKALDYLSENVDNPEKIPDLILLDIHMPEMNGFEFLDHFSKFSRSIIEKCKIVILSSTIHERDIKKALQHPLVKKIISKPLDSEMFKQYLIDELKFWSSEN